ncbi:hypothetical protein DCS_05441 [Drechmeria coniospora]|uniref:BTB domain-containing protein n=1 Tax=Drechmeria coniospora TaxID=98403 RepID=A0A151GMV1_DRECN|nr:hypothetical protein DCS_05441 [Drechmeria coniospora]KYK58426.1 hypothetical protein DCS_05441 [Drechmeria coniospora]ODA83925.1 hypothetical protein RJ55_02442 [Drechmeria coniospora]
MVSQPEPAPVALSHRRGPFSVSSVATRPSLSRTRRYNRSHGGGASHVPQNEFPVFALSGDVEILVRAGPSEHRYLLHRHTLTRCSGFFEASTSSEWSKARPLAANGHELARIGESPSLPEDLAPLTNRRDDAFPTATATPRRRWRYELDPGAGEGDIPMLVQKNESEPPHAGSKPGVRSIFGEGVGTDSSASRSTTSRKHDRGNQVAFACSVTNLSVGARSPMPLSQAEEQLLRDYDNLFRIFYNYPPALDGINVVDAYVQCKSLLALADQYDALAVVGPRVDHHLLQFQSRLWTQVAKYPISYLRLGYLARSKVIFREALIHVVGQWPIGGRSGRATLPDVVLDIIEDKVEELDETVSQVEGCLFRLSLTTARGDRVTPNTSYLDWLVVSLFRQWLAENTTPQPPPDRHHCSRSRSCSRNVNRNRNRNHGRHPSLPSVRPPPTSVGAAYRTLGAGNSTFLGHDECKSFLKLTPELYSRENLRRFERRMEELKAMARDLVHPLLDSALELDTVAPSRTSDGLPYLTCTTVGNWDLPWPVDD